jgi:predicted ArsR family transcriptional regulator
MQLIFTVMLKRPVESSLKSSLKCSWKIIELISQNIQITIIELADQIGITTRAVDKQIANLKKHTSNAVGFHFAR